MEHQEGEANQTSAQAYNSGGQQARSGSCWKNPPIERIVMDKDKLREEINNMALEFVINENAKKRLLKAVDSLKCEHECIVWKRDECETKCPIHSSEKK